MNNVPNYASVTGFGRSGQWTWRSQRLSYGRPISTRNDRASCLISSEHDTTRCVLLGSQTRHEVMQSRTRHERRRFKRANSCLTYQFLSTSYLHPANFHQRGHSVRVHPCPSQITSARV